MLTLACAEASEKTSRLPQAEHPMDKARRLAKELAEVLPEVQNGRWYVTVYPSYDWCQYPIMFGDIRSARDARRLVDYGLINAVDAHKRAAAQFNENCYLSDSVALGREPTASEWRLYRRFCRAEEAALNAVAGWVTSNHVSAAYKAKHLLKYMRRSALEERHITLLLKSMCRRGTV